MVQRLPQAFAILSFFMPHGQSTVRRSIDLPQDVPSAQAHWYKIELLRLDLVDTTPGMENLGQCVVVVG